MGNVRVGRMFKFIDLKTRWWDYLLWTLQFWVSPNRFRASAKEVDLPMFPLSSVPREEPQEDSSGVQGSSTRSPEAATHSNSTAPWEHPESLLLREKRVSS
jgi:hypothetical protein